MTDSRGRGRPPIGARIELRLPADVLTAVDESAEQLGVTRSELLRQIVTEWHLQR